MRSGGQIRLQEIAYGGLAEKTQAKLKRIYEKQGKQRAGKRERCKRGKMGIPVPGTLLIRDRNGEPRYCDVIRKRWATHVRGEECDWVAATPTAEK